LKSNEVAPIKCEGRKFNPFALSPFDKLMTGLPKGHSWFDKPVLSEAEELTTNGIYR